MDIIQLSIRILAFGVTLFMLLEFIVVCDVDTFKALAFLGGALMLVVILFMLFKRYELIKCEACGNSKHKPFLNKV